MKHYYVSGPISNPDARIQSANLRRMRLVSMQLRRGGNEVLNPGDWESDGVSWEKYLARDLLWLHDNRPTMYMMKGWKTSRGARLEFEFAKLLGLEVEYEA